MDIKLVAPQGTSKMHWVTVTRVLLSARVVLMLYIAQCAIVGSTWTALTGVGLAHTHALLAAPPTCVYHQ